MKICYTRFVVLTTSALTWWQTIFSTTGSAYLTIRVHSQEKACPSTHTNPGNAVMTQLMSCLYEHLPRNGSIFFVTFLRNALRKSLETHGVDNVKPYRSQS